MPGQKVVRVADGVTGVIVSEWRDSQGRLFNGVQWSDGSLTSEIVAPVNPSGSSADLPVRLVSDHHDHDVRRIWRTDGTNTTYLLCRTCNSTFEREA